MSKSKRLMLFSLICLLAFFILSAGVRGKLSGDEEKKDADDTRQKRDIDYVEVEDDDDLPRKKPIKRKDTPPPEDSVAGFLLLSNGDRIDGHVHLTRDGGVKVTHTEKKKLLRIRLDEVTHIEQRPTLERMEKEWRWVENANDEKVYTGREYPMRKLETIIHMKKGRTLKGLLMALIFVDNENGSRRFVLHKRQKGKPGTKMSDLIYVKTVDFRPPEKKDEKGAENKDAGKSGKEKDSEADKSGKKAAEK